MAESFVDHESALNEARKQMSNTGALRPGDLHVPQNGKADNYPQDDGSDSHGDRLEAARKGKIKTAANIAKDLAAATTPVGAASLGFSLLKQIDLLADMPYVAAFGAAMLKDLLDSVAGPTVVLAILFSMLCSIFIFMMMLLAGSNGKKKGASKFFAKSGILVAGGIADSLPGIDFAPIETATVAVIYFLTLVERKYVPQQGKADNYSQEDDDQLSA